MEASFFENASSAFEGLCKSYHLSIKEIDDNEVAIWGAGFALLVFLVPHEGVSIKYVDFDKEFVEFVDVAMFIVKHRAWIADTSVPCEQDFKSKVKRELRYYARNLEKSATDILEGKKDWLARGADRPINLETSCRELQRRLMD